VTYANVTIDACILASPRQDEAADVAHRYVERLLDWSNLLDEPWVSICMSERASAALHEDGLYPLRDHLRQLFSTQNIVEYDVNTVAMVIDRLLQITPSFETYFSIQDILAEELMLEPDILCLCSGNKLQTDLARCVVLIAILREHCREPLNNHSLILRRAPDRTVQVRAKIYILEHEREDLTPFPVHPEYFEGSVLICDDFKGLVACLNEEIILLRATDNIGVDTAIRIAMYKSRLNSGVEPEWNDIPAYRVGRLFRKILHEIHPTEQLASRVLRAIVESLEQVNMATTHKLRTGVGGGNPQQMRGRDKAMRRDIDHEYHLHYWQCEDGTIELASVVVHDDFSIPE
jgi:hypothetical protein